MSDDTKVDDGRPVYPCKRREAVNMPPIKAGTGGTCETVEVEYPGITRRDYYAGLAMQGLLTALGLGIESFHKDKLVILSYEIADAMIAESRKGEL